jgi:hypothetical protein
MGPKAPGGGKPVGARSRVRHRMGPEPRAGPRDPAGGVRPRLSVGAIRRRAVARRGSCPSRACARDVRLGGRAGAPPIRAHHQNKEISARTMPTMPARGKTQRRKKRWRRRSRRLNLDTTNSKQVRTQGREDQCVERSRLIASGKIRPAGGVGGRRRKKRVSRTPLARVPPDERDSARPPKVKSITTQHHREAAETYSYDGRGAEWAPCQVPGGSPTSTPISAGFRGCSMGSLTPLSRKWQFRATLSKELAEGMAAPFLVLALAGCAFVAAGPGQAPNAPDQQSDPRDTSGMH